MTAGWDGVGAGAVCAGAAGWSAGTTAAALVTVGGGGVDGTEGAAGAALTVDVLGTSAGALDGAADESGAPDEPLPTDAAVGRTAGTGASPAAC